MSSTKAPLLPTVKGMNGSTNSAAAINDGKSADVKLTDMRKFSGGKRKKSYRGGEATQMQSPQFTMAYKPTGGDGQDPNALITTGIQNQNQSNVNAGGDNYARQVGGKRKKTMKSRKRSKSRNRQKNKTRRRMTKRQRW